MIKDHDVYALQDEAQTNILIGYERVSSQLEFDSSYAAIRQVEKKLCKKVIAVLNHHFCKKNDIVCIECLSCNHHYHQQHIEKITIVL